MYFYIVSERKPTDFNTNPQTVQEAEVVGFRNETLPDCDPTLFQMSINFDNYWWEEDNLTDLCLGNCSYQATLWDRDVTQACAEQWIPAYGKLIPADSISGRYVNSVKTACLSST